MRNNELVECSGMANERDWGKHSAYAGYLSCLATLVMGVLGVAVGIFAIYRTDKNPPCVWISVALWTWLITWGPITFSALCLSVSIFTWYRIYRSLPTRQAFIQRSRDLTDANAALANLKADRDAEHLQWDRDKALLQQARNEKTVAEQEKYDLKREAVKEYQLVVGEQKDKLKDLSDQLASSQQQIEELKSALRNDNASLALPAQEPPKVSAPSGQADSLSIDIEGKYVLLFNTHATSGTHGIIGSFSNNSARVLRDILITVTDGVSLDSRLKQYRESFNFKPVTIGAGSVLEAGDKLESFWLVHKPKGKIAHLLGRSDQNPLKWPNNDLSKVRLWKITVALNATCGAATDKTPLSFTGRINVSWSEEADQFALWYCY